jgi:hypothetical protein
MESLFGLGYSTSLAVVIAALPFVIIGCHGTIVVGFGLGGIGASSRGRSMYSRQSSIAEHFPMPKCLGCHGPSFKKTAFHFGQFTGKRRHIITHTAERPIQDATKSFPHVSLEHLCWHGDEKTQNPGEKQYIKKRSI